MPPDDESLIPVVTMRHLSYCIWVLIKSSPLPVFIRQSLLMEAPLSLRVCYHGVSKTLQLVCDCRDSAHIDPRDAHEKITMIAMSNVMSAFSPRFYPSAHDLLKSYIRSCWGEGISFVGFRTLLIECYNFIKNVSNAIVIVSSHVEFYVVYSSYSFFFYYV
jgi:hypothetical protein